MQDFSLAPVAGNLVVVEADDSGARAAVVVAWLAERDGDEVRVSPVVVSDDATGSLLRVVRDRGPGHAAIVPCRDPQGLPADDVEAIARELRIYKGEPKRMVAHAKV